MTTAYARAVAECRRAAATSRAARAGLQGAVHAMHDAFRSRPLTALAATVVAGFVLAQARIGGGLVRAGARIASGPAWGLLRQWFREQP